jgi:hypothetical protein
MADAPKPAEKKPNTEAETRATFVAMANKRTSSAIRALANVAKLPTKGRRQTDASTIVAALTKAVGQVEARLQSGKDAEPEFKLD